MVRFHGRERRRPLEELGVFELAEDRHVIGVRGSRGEGERERTATMARV